MSTARLILVGLALLAVARAEIHAGDAAAPEVEGVPAKKAELPAEGFGAPCSTINRRIGRCAAKIEICRGDRASGNMYKATACATNYANTCASSDNHADREKAIDKAADRMRDLKNCKY